MEIPSRIIRVDAAGRRYYESVSGRVYVADAFELYHVFHAPFHVAKKARLLLELEQLESSLKSAKSTAESLLENDRGLKSVTEQLEAILENVVKQSPLHEDVKCEECGKGRIMFAIFEKGKGWRLVCPACATSARERGAKIVLLSDR
jgi:formylmethanofuran dehydrogenase subunit E